MSTIEGYASSTSVFPQETLTFHVRTENPDSSFRIDIYRQGKDEVLVHSDTGNATSHTIPNNASEAGCDWPESYRLSIPQDWSSGVYTARLTPESSEETSDILFVVKPSSAGTNASILLQLTVTTYQAYNNWGGSSLYDPSNAPAKRVSFNRPDSIGLSLFHQWEHLFITWLENNDFTVDYCTSIDIHTNSIPLNSYRLLLSIGHDEYWSWEMRDNVEAFIANGGNVAFFSGNTCWWQMRFEDDNRVMVCYKPRTPNEDPINAINPKRVTTNWRSSPVNRPENSLTGVSFKQGAGWWIAQAGNRPAVGYQVRFSKHWIFENTGLNDNDEFGADALIIGYETDAALFNEQNGLPQVTGTDGTPLNFIILATADLSNWGAGGQAGKATMGIHRNKGTVFTAATTDWSNGLTQAGSIVSQITQNILKQLSSPFPPSPKINNADFEQWNDSTEPLEWLIERASTDKGIISRDENNVFNGEFSLLVDATEGQTWLSQEFLCEGRNSYSVGCWVKAQGQGATIRLQSTQTWRDFAIARYDGDGQWEFISAVGKVDDEGALFGARVKIEVAEGTVAWFDSVIVNAL